MNAQELADKLLKRLGNWGLIWEVLWTFFSSLIKEHGITEENIDKLIEEACSEWDI